MSKIFGCAVSMVSHVKVMMPKCYRSAVAKFCCSLTPILVGGYMRDYLLCVKMA